jgi:hypothetical protein
MTDHEFATLQPELYVSRDFTVLPHDLLGKKIK